MNSCFAVEEAKATSFFDSSVELEVGVLDLDGADFRQNGTAQNSTVIAETTVVNVAF